jgi:hypothetical protein
MKNLETYLQNLPALSTPMMKGRITSFLKKPAREAIKEGTENKSVSSVIEELIESGAKPSTANGNEIYQIGDINVGLIVYSFAEGGYKTVGEFVNPDNEFFKKNEDAHKIKMAIGQANRVLNSLNKNKDKTKFQSALDMVAEGYKPNIGYEVDYKVGEYSVGKMAYDYAVFLTSP